MTLEIKADRLYRNGKPVEFRATPNQGGRIESRFVVLHDTCGFGHGRGTISWFTQRRSRVSAHFLITEDGTIHQFVDIDRKAWHCGKSRWNNIRNLNGHSIGIEMANPGKLWRRGDAYVASNGRQYNDASIVAKDTADHGASGGHWKPYSRAQIASLEQLVACLFRDVPTLQEVVGHHDISPGRKVDPTPLMPWSRVRDAAERGKSISSALVPDAADEAMTRRVQNRLNELGFGAGPVDG